MPVTQDPLHVHRGNAGGHQLAGVTMAEGMRRRAEIKAGEFPIALHQLLDRPDRQRTVTLVLKERRRRGCAEPPRRVEANHLANASLVFTPLQK